MLKELRRIEKQEHLLIGTPVVTILSYLVGLLLYLPLSRLIPDEDFYPIRTCLLLVLLLLICFWQLFFFGRDFNTALRLGAVRKQYLAARALLLLMQLFCWGVLAWLIRQLERQVAPSESSLLTMADDPKSFTAFLLCLWAVALFLGASFARLNGAYQRLSALLPAALSFTYTTLVERGKLPDGLLPLLGRFLSRGPLSLLLFFTLILLLLLGYVLHGRRQSVSY